MTVYSLILLVVLFNLFLGWYFEPGYSQYLVSSATYDELDTRSGRLTGHWLLRRNLLVSFIDK